MKKIAGCLMTMLVILSCDEDAALPIVIKGDSYFPLHVGDHWQYKPANEEFPQMNEHIPVVTREIKGIEPVGDHEYFFMLITYDYSKQNRPTDYDSVYYRVDDNGFVYALDNKTGAETNPFRLGASDGDRWTYAAVFGVGEISVKRIESVDLGSYSVKECKRFYFDIAQMADEENYTVLGPGIGIVSQGNAWGFDMKLERAVIDSNEYRF